MPMMVSNHCHINIAPSNLISVLSHSHHNMNFIPRSLFHHNDGDNSTTSSNHTCPSTGTDPGISSRNRVAALI
jgi:hypothetical protein